MKNILVTGANGFVGHHLVKELAAGGHNVTGIGGRNIPSDASGEVANYLTLDLLDPEATKQIDFTDIDGVIHLAGLAAVGPSFDNPELYMTSNVGMQVNLFEAALAQNAFPKFIIISTGALYDLSAPLPLTETSPLKPTSPYAQSKVEQEKSAQSYLDKGFECIIARPFNHIGPGQNPGFIVPDLAQQIVAVSRGASDTVMVGNLDARRDYTDVRDIARAYRLLLDHGKSGETYNICSGRSISGHDILQRLLDASGVNPTVAQDPEKMRPVDNPDIYGDHAKLTTDTGWQPEIDLSQTFADVIADWKNRA